MILQRFARGVQRTAFKKGHIVREEDVCHLRRLGKENLFVLNIAEDEMHETMRPIPLRMHC